MAGRKKGEPAKPRDPNAPRKITLALAPETYDAFIATAKKNFRTVPQEIGMLISKHLEAEKPAAAPVA